MKEHNEFLIYLQTTTSPFRYFDDFVEEIDCVPGVKSPKPKDIRVRRISEIRIEFGF